MIAKAIDRIIGLSEPHIISTPYGNFTDKRLERMPEGRRAREIEVQTLSALVDYVRNIKDQTDNRAGRGYFVHVESPKEVRLLSGLDHDQERECLVYAKAQTPKIPFEQFVEQEKMIISLQTAFARDPSTDLDMVMQFAGTATAGTIKDYSDDGVSQKATVSSGVRGKEDKLVPSPCTLRPIRTFLEVEQPKSPFIFRLRSGSDDTVLAGLFDADGGAWKLDAVYRITAYLREALNGTGVEVIG